ncbi:hypothetical protein GQ43DRAFT_479509 [Delitschia confertaspora ATCC 74209]|uniref:Uncharacterized protein n=1 Tax=Delitschia confertaspora ATCC 74209 TaxID=1513339 RepID=A0A9P4JR73_9PLEO|nr:hypothetical protein GQ43DRAFT_479509 [Delitschia confertaspora ATCC 74209]
MLDTRRIQSGSTNSFWTRFSGFTPNSKAGLPTEFKRLARHMCWVPNSDEWRKYREEAYTSEFEFWYGSDSTKLERWQQLCEEVGISPAPPSITKCRKALRGVHINLVDLVNCRRSGFGRPRRFQSYQQLRNYTLNRRTYPKEAAKKEGFIKELLRVLL